MDGPGPGNVAVAEQSRAVPVGPVPMLGQARRLIESAAIALVTSTGLYLVGSVYADAYYSRLSIEVTALDLAPPFIALQAIHAPNSLLQYPFTLLLLYGIYRVISSHATWMLTGYDRARQRFGRLFLLIVNLAVIAPLVIAAVRAGSDEALFQANSAISEIATLMESLGLVLLVYVIWLSFGPRVTLFSQLRAHKLLPIALVFVVYLLDALIATSHGAAEDAELLMMGIADTSVAVKFTMADDVGEAFSGAELIFVTARNGNFFVVERQDLPPSQRPISYAIPYDSVDVARMQRVNAADASLFGDEMPQWLDELFGTPEAP